MITFQSDCKQVKEILQSNCAVNLLSRLKKSDAALFNGAKSLSSYLNRPAFGAGWNYEAAASNNIFYSDWLVLSRLV